MSSFSWKIADVTLPDGTTFRLATNGVSLVIRKPGWKSTEVVMPRDGNIDVQIFTDHAYTEQGDPPEVTGKRNRKRIISLNEEKSNE